MAFAGIGIHGNRNVGSKADYRKSLAVSGYDITLVISGIIAAIAIATRTACRPRTGNDAVASGFSYMKGYLIKHKCIPYLYCPKLCRTGKLWDVKVSKAALITIMWIIVVAASAGTHI